MENWQCMLSCIVANRGLVLPSLVNAIERFVTGPWQLVAIEREFSIGDPFSYVRSFRFVGQRPHVCPKFAEMTRYLLAPMQK
ncbi:hypothetical protein [Paraburkholderia sp. MM5482-R1]|uniref:hypothetical protein n=1 Tax=unclassified Paraburkholderia TaxID=2615204 RepID=UPI003D20D884